MKEILEFRGVKEGIYIDVHTSDFNEAKAELEVKLEKNRNFYRDVKLIDVVADNLTEREIVELKLILRYRYELFVSDENLPKDIFSNHHKKDIEKKSLQDFKDIDCAVTKFIYGTVRSGQEIHFDGNIVIVGDVNPGAYVACTGHLIVMGIFRGVCHIGANGNEKALLACYNLKPVQVRIAGKVAVISDSSEVLMPEIVHIKNKEVVVEQYLPNKGV